MVEEKVKMVRLEDVHHILQFIKDHFDISLLDASQEGGNIWGKDPTIYEVSLITSEPKQ